MYWKLIPGCCALDLLEAHSRLLDHPPKRSVSVLPQSGRMGPPNYRGQRTAVYDGLHKKREGGSADRRAPSQTSTATPKTRSCMRCAVGMEASAIIKIEINQKFKQTQFLEHHSCIKLLHRAD